MTLADLALHHSLHITARPVIQRPIRELVDLAENAHVAPIFWPAETPSTSASYPLHKTKVTDAQQVWDYARRRAIEAASALTGYGAHHTIINRLLAPFLPQTVVISSSTWRDFLDQRRSISLQGNNPLICAELAIAASVIRAAIGASKPEPLTLGQWHLPYLRDHELRTLPQDQARKISVVRCDVGGAADDDDVFDLQNELTHYALTAPTIRVDDPFQHVCTPAARGETTTGPPGWHPLTRPRPGEPPQ